MHMLSETVTLQKPEILYQRLVSTDHATQRPLEEVIIHALQVASPQQGMMFQKNFNLK